MTPEIPLATLEGHTKGGKAVCEGAAPIGVVVVVAQLVRAPDCGSGGWGFKSPQPPWQ